MHGDEPLPTREESSDRGALLRLVQPLVVRTARLIVGSGSPVAEEAAQEALVAIWRAREVPSDERALRVWAVTVATRTAARYAKRERRVGWLGRERIDADDRVPARVAADLLELKEAFDALPPRQRAVAVLRLYAGLREDETAAALGCSVGTVKSQLHDARRALRRHLGAPEPKPDRSKRPRRET